MTETTPLWITWALAWLGGFLMGGSSAFYCFKIYYKKRGLKTLTSLERRYLVVIACLVIFIPMANSSYGFGEVAGKINLKLKLGETKTFQWGLVSNETMTVSLSAIGNGSKYIILPKTVTIQPNQILWINVTAKIPLNYTDKSNLTSIMLATHAGKHGGQTVLNTQMAKLVSINIDHSRSIPEFPFSIMMFGLLVAFSIIIYKMKQSTKLLL